MKKIIFDFLISMPLIGLTLCVFITDTKLNDWLAIILAIGFGYGLTMALCKIFVELHYKIHGKTPWSDCENQPYERRESINDNAKIPVDNLGNQLFATETIEGYKLYYLIKTIKGQYTIITISNIEGEEITKDIFEDYKQYLISQKLSIMTEEQYNAWLSKYKDKVFKQINPSIEELIDVALYSDDELLSSLAQKREKQTLELAREAETFDEKDPKNKLEFPAKEVTEKLFEKQENTGNIDAKDFEVFLREPPKPTSASFTTAPIIEKEQVQTPVLKKKVIPKKKKTKKKTNIVNTPLPSLKKKNIKKKK